MTPSEYGATLAEGEPEISDQQAEAAARLFHIASGDGAVAA